MCVPINVLNLVEGTPTLVEIKQWVFCEQPLIREFTKKSMSELLGQIWADD